MTRVWRAVPILVIVGFAVLTAGLLYWPVQALFAHVPLSYNEGWNGFHSLRLRTGGPLYPPIAPDLFINYPPLSFYIVSTVARLIGDDIVAGRVVALVALLITALNVGLIARRLGAPREIAIIAGFAFICFVGLYFTDYVGVNDPQWDLHALQTTGLVVLLRDRTSWQSIAIAALLMVLGGLVKHSAMLLPLAVTIWLLLEDRVALRRWLVALLGFGVVAIGLCLLAYGHAFIDQVIGLGRTYTLAIVTLVAWGWGAQLAPFVVAGTVGALFEIRRPAGRFVLTYIIVALIGGTLLMTGAGVIYNTLFDLVIAMMLGCALFAGFLIERYGKTDRTMAMATALAAILFAARFVMLAPHALSSYELVTEELAQQPQWAATIERVRTEPGRIACETMALCYWAGRHSEIEFFNFGQRALLDPGYDAAFTQAVQDGSIGLIQLDPDAGAHRLSPALEALIATRYVAVQSTPTVLMVPR